MKARGLEPAIAAFILLAGISTLAQAAVEREDIVVLDADGRHFTSYKTLRSDLSERVLYLGPDESAADAMYIVPSDYQAESQADGGTRLRFNTGNYSIMSAGRLASDEISRTDNGDLIFTSWDGQRRADGHHGKWNSPDDFASFAYSWVVPDNIRIKAYRANRAGDWTHKGNTLSWHGTQVNDIAFTIRYRVHKSGAKQATATPAAQAPEKSASQPARTAQRSRAPLERLVPADLAPRDMDTSALQTAPAERVAPPMDDPSAASPAAASSAPQGGDSVLLDAAVTMDDGKPRITDDGRAVLDRLVRKLADNAPDRMMITGPAFARPDDRDDSAAQAARVADYLKTHGLAADRITTRAGAEGEATEASGIRITVEPAGLLAGFQKNAP